jgi:hypothetical protein
LLDYPILDNCVWTAIPRVELPSLGYDSKTAVLQPSIYNFSTLNPDSGLVYLFGDFSLPYNKQKHLILLRDSEEIFHSYRFPTVTFANVQVQVKCQFHHPRYPLATNQARYFWRMFLSSGVVCDLPKLQDSPNTYTPRLVIDDEIYYAAAPLQVIKPRKVQHKLCQCLVMWKRSEVLLDVSSITLMYTVLATPSTCPRQRDHDVAQMVASTAQH